MENGKLASWITKLTTQIKIDDIKNYVAEPFKTLFPEEIFRSPKYLLSKYLFYFPNDNKVYICKAANVWNKIYTQFYFNWKYTIKYIY